MLNVIAITRKIRKLVLAVASSTCDLAIPFPFGLMFLYRKFEGSAFYVCPLNLARKGIISRHRNISQLRFLRENYLKIIVSSLHFEILHFFFTFNKVWKKEH